MQDLREKLLLYRVQTDRDAQAYARLYDLYVERIYRFVYFKVSGREEAEDIVSEVFAAGWDYLSGGRERQVKSFRALIYKIARNKVVDCYRARAAQATVPLSEAGDIAVYDKQYEQIAANEDARKALSALKKMKREYHEIVVLKYVEEMSAAEIAEVLGKSPTNVRVTLHRAVKILKKILEQG